MPAPKTHPITIQVSARMLREIDGRIPDRRRICREQFVMDALEAYLSLRTVKPLKLDGPKPPKFIKAISESTGQLKTGRYDP